MYVSSLCFRFQQLCYAFNIRRVEAFGLKICMSPQNNDKAARTKRKLKPYTTTICPVL